MLRDGPANQPGSSIEVLTVEKQHDYADHQTVSSTGAQEAVETFGPTDAEAQDRSKHTGSRNSQKRAREEMADTSMTEVHRCPCFFTFAFAGD